MAPDVNTVEPANSALVSCRLPTVPQVRSDRDIMNDATRELLIALKEANDRIPRLSMEILDQTILPDSQCEFGARLVQLGELVQRHAGNNHDSPA